MAANRYDTREDVLAANPPIPVTLYSDWWTCVGDEAGTVAARGNNALVTAKGGAYLGTFSWRAVLQTLNDERGNRLPIHDIAYLRRLVAERADSKTLKYLKGPRET